MIKVTVKELQEKIVSINLEGTMIYGKTEYANNELSKIDVNYEGYVFVLTNLAKIDSTGFGILINFAKRVNKKVVIVVKNELIKRLIHIAKLNLIFWVVETEEEALTKFNAEQSPPLTVEEY